ncbi:uncharacterized protein LOC143586599 [Bidens hawaiensis]|uniref:uncharacterized protein LOC143586599 n=1 Tax=Bidens hawaiensis TaxID=980011 RepID=UPI004049EFB5
MASSFHPAVTVTNIKNFILIILDSQNEHYNTWAELFVIHCKAYDAFDHLQPCIQAISSSSSDKEKETTKTPHQESWERIDAIVLQWIYGTITRDLVHTIKIPNTTAYDAWCRLKNLFLDNQTTRTIAIQNKFFNSRLDQFPDISAYCQHMKLLYDQLTSLGSPVTKTNSFFKS